MGNIEFTNFEHSALLILSLLDTEDDNLKILITEFVKANGPSKFLKKLEHFDLPFSQHMKLQSLRQLLKYINVDEFIEKKSFLNA